MVLEARRMEISAQNLFHAQTPGFKAARMLRAAEVTASVAAGPSDVQPVMAGQYVDPQQGPLRFTGKRLDLALEGNGFFVVETPGGLAVTRDGRFRLTEDKVLVDGSGHPVLGQDGPIQFPDESKWDAAVQVQEDGTFYVDGEEVERIRLVEHPGYRGLQAAGGSLFYPVGTASGQPSEARVIQHTLEDSNASVVAEMTRSIQITRAFEAYQKTIQTVMDDLTGEAVRRIGRVA
jgi:flagellar basal-body rod protein FlgG